MVSRIKVLAILLIIGLCLVPEQVSHASIFDNIKIPKVDVDEIIKSQVKNATISKHLILTDGTYYSGNIQKKFRKNNGVVEENSFNIDEPSLVVFHGINEGYNASMTFSVYDDDNYKISDKIHIGSNETKDCNLFLKPGKYKLKVEFFSLDKNGYCDYKYKLTKTSIDCNVKTDISSSNNACKIKFNECIYNYFRTIGDWGQDRKSQYYTFSLTETTNVKLIAKKGDIGNCSVSLLDSDERLIKRKLYFDTDNKIFETFTLNPGVYFLRVERGSILGSTYNVEIN